MARSRWLSWILGAALLLGLALAAARYLRGEVVLAALARFDPAYALPLLLLSALAFWAKGWRFVSLMRPLSPLAGGVVLRGYLAGEAASLLPGGVAARAALMRQVGVPIAASSAPILMSSALDQLAFLASALLAALWFEAARPAALSAAAVLALLGALLGFAPARRWAAGVLRRLMARAGLGEGWLTFGSALRATLRPAPLGAALLTTVLSFGLRVAVLDLSLRGLGLTAPWAALFLAYILPTLAGRLSVLPGGVGITEAGMIGVLAATSSLSADQAAAGTAVFRVATLLLEALLGTLVYFFAWRGAAEPRALRKE
ncbi:uncharacterized membrane protein YbhN (UPF0104 family) [Deinobacterium chartae]|uniref:Uncharacterized membrane protein YbhN (UPF0104 family) n=1 Tax=Deinobacterium chartae TaxID=521158 RepID=A0A841I446_9DEIO|nr:lysylphosphatidylglycerol synthase domain-containing protein [Deinobacterium chartae]MBB6099079.1 uncharacterized membrane protein YbhN (UPF0104 family) [Deinobacterium chartae]